MSNHEAQFTIGNLMKKYLLLPALLASYILLVIPFTAYMRNKPFVEKLGYVPQAEVLKFVSADQKLLVADSLVMKTLFYFGSLVEKSSAKLEIPPDYFSIFRTIETAIRVNPYNIDAYYFAQAILVWDAKRIREANSLLEYGLKYRKWDYQLPFYLGFNYAYFLKDYQAAARYYKLAGELSGEPLFVNLAGRYMYEAGRTDLALIYLTAMEKSARNPAIRKTYKVRIAALLQVKAIEGAMAAYQGRFGTPSKSIDDLLRMGFLSKRPVDPYGGTFYIDEKGQVRATSKFAFAAPVQ